MGLRVLGGGGGSILTLRLGPAGLTLTPIFFEGQPGLGEGRNLRVFSSPVRSRGSPWWWWWWAGPSIDEYSKPFATNERTIPFRLSTPRSSPVSPVKGQLWPHAAMGRNQITTEGNV